MFSLNDLILLIVIFASLAAGIVFHKFGSHFQPYLLYFTMGILFLSFLSVRVETILKSIRPYAKTILWLTFLKIIAVPVIVYYIFLLFCPSYALGALLLTGVSTGAVAPFISTLLGANQILVLLMVVVSSLLIPFSLPALIKILLGQSFEIPFLLMVRMLCLVIFIPMFAVELLRRLAPKPIQYLANKRFYFSLVLFTVTNLGVFSKYADFFYREPLSILGALLVAILLTCFYLIVGVVSLWKADLETQIASSISFGNMNNVLIIVFASEFFGPLEPTLAAVYMVPFFGLILPLRFYQRFKTGRVN